MRTTLIWDLSKEIARGKRTGHTVKNKRKRNSLFFAENYYITALKQYKGCFLWVSSVMGFMKAIHFFFL